MSITTCIHNNFHNSSYIYKRIESTLREGIQYDLPTEKCSKYLKNHINQKLSVAVLYVDISNSTKMSLSIPQSQFVSILNVFSQEMSFIIAETDGFVLKYVGDAVIGLFPIAYNEAEEFESVIICGISMINSINNIINPVLRKNKLPEIAVKIGMEFGDLLVMLYGKDMSKSQVDLIGSTMSVASKITSIAKHNQILVGKNLYDKLQNTFFKEKFFKVERDSKWSFDETYSTLFPHSNQHLLLCN